jgi:hypothetical protein
MGCIPIDLQDVMANVPSFLPGPAQALGSNASNATLNLNTNQVADGRVGIILGLPAGTTFVEETQQVLSVEFRVAEDSGDITVPITFGGQPILREVSGVGAQPLPTSYDGGTIKIGQGYEADVSPLPNGNQLVTITDWVKVGRYSAGLDPVTNRVQFQRADCAPLASSGNGAMTVSDWVQAGRYAAGLDPLMPAGGPTEPGQVGLLGKSARKTAMAAPASANRFVRVGTAAVQPGQTNVIPVQLVAQGSESALGFSLGFSTSVLSFVSVSLGSNAAGGSLNVNTNQLTAGRLGVALSLPIGNSFAAGTTGGGEGALRRAGGSDGQHHPRVHGRARAAGDLGSVRQRTARQLCGRHPDAGR